MRNSTWPRLAGRLPAAFSSLPAAAALCWLSASTPLAAQDLVVDLAAMDPSQGLISRVSGRGGESRRGNFGVPVAGGLDMDGDGHNDLAVAYMTASPMGRNGAGEVYLAFGRGVLGESLAAEASPRVLRIIGGQPEEACGDEIWMDDVTGDGLGDLLIGRQNFGSEDRPFSGALTVVAGSPALRDMAEAGSALDLADPAAAAFTLRGAQESGRLGIWMRAGDVDGDGIADIVVGADKEDGDDGALYVLRGGPHLAAGMQADLAQPGQSLAGRLARIAPPAPADDFHFGGTCQLADLDGNGRAEVLGAATLNRSGATLGPGEGRGGAERGALFIVWDDAFPPGPWPEDFQFSIDSAPGTVTALRGTDGNISFGEEILGGEDLDGDGRAELFVGDLVAESARGLGYVVFGAEALKGLDARIDELPAGIPLTIIRGPSEGAIGSDTAALGDFDHDGFADLMVGSPHDAPLGRSSAGTVHIFFGQNAPWPERVDSSPGGLAGLRGLRATEIRGARGGASGDLGDTLCYSAASGDVDGDGLPELIINEMLGNGPGPEDVDVGNLLVLGALAVSPARGAQPIPGRPIRTHPVRRGRP